MTELNSEHTTPLKGAAGEIFATTRWTVVLAAGRRSGPQADMALEELCRTYWFPLYSYVRRHGHSKENAEDLTQAFFLRFLEKNYLEGLDSDKGKFRAFLLASLKHFLANEWDRANRQKRGGGVAPLSLDWQEADARYQINPADNLSPDKLDASTWAVTLLERVITRLRDECAAEGRARLFRVIEAIPDGRQKRHSLCRRRRRAGLERRRDARGGASPAQSLPGIVAR